MFSFFKNTKCEVNSATQTTKLSVGRQTKWIGDRSRRRECFGKQRCVIKQYFLYFPQSVTTLQLGLNVLYVTKIVKCSKLKNRI